MLELEKVNQNMGLVFEIEKPNSKLTFWECRIEKTKTPQHLFSMSAEKLNIFKAKNKYEDFHI